MSGLICWCGDGLHVENETPFCDSCGTVYSCVDQAKEATAKTIERNNLFIQSKNDELKLTDQANTIAALEREVERLKKDAARLRPALEETVKSLEIISQQAGESRGLSTFTQIKQYALDWVRTVRKDLADRYGCHCDLEVGMEPDDCVIDSGQINDCVHAQIGMRENSNFRREYCKYWQPINIKALAGREAENV